MKATPGSEPTAPGSAASVGAAPGASRYRRLRRFFITLPVTAALIPVTVMTAVIFHQDRKALQAEIAYNLSQILSNTKRTLEFIIEERRSALTLMINERLYEELATEDGLAAALRHLKQSFGGFVDIGLIDADGIQRAYVGPYELKGRNYREQPWFQEASLRGVAVSDVFMGYRNFPHFVVAVRHERTSGAFYILRATLDMNLLTRQLHPLDNEPFTDVFLVNGEGVLQTSSRNFGPALGRLPLPVPAAEPRESISPLAAGKLKGWQTATVIEQSPFILMVLNTRTYRPLDWMQSRMELLWFLGISVLLIVVAVVYTANFMVNRLREADLRRAKLFHNVEYTNKMATIGRLAASVAHEINNPLAIINEKAGLLMDLAHFGDDLKYKDKIVAAVKSITQSVDRCSTVTHRLLGFARRMEPRKEMIDLEGLMQEVIGFLGKEVIHRNIQITVRVKPGTPPVESDRGQLQQVFLNIINNALEAVSDGGRIDINVEPRNGRVAVTVADNGRGISEEDMKHIFEPFFSTKGEFGTGLGLSITRDIVQRLGGEISVQGRLGEGTSFTVTLPERSA